MLRQEYNPIMARLVIEFRATVDEALLTTYFQRVENMTPKKFQAACNACVLELDFFPSVHQIIERLPITGKSDWDRAKDDLKKVEYESIFGVQDNERGSDDLETQIDALTDDELVEIFRASADPQWMANNGVTDMGLWFSVRQFRANPNGAIYRGVIRDQLREMAR